MIRRAVLALAVVALALTGCAQTPTSTGDSIGYVAGDGALVLKDVEQRGEPIDIRGELIDGTAWNLASLRGQVVLLNAWGPWCAPCRTEVPLLQDLRDSLPGLQVIGFATRTDRVAVEAFLEARDISYPQVADYDSRLFLGVRGVPSMSIPGTLIIDTKGRVAGWALGAVDTGVLGDFAQALVDEA